MREQMVAHSDDLLPDATCMTLKIAYSSVNEIRTRPTSRHHSLAVPTTDETPAK